MEIKKDFRKKVLQLHYDISKGSTWNLVMRTLVAEKLDLANYNNDELLGTIKYLEDKGYLKVVTNMEDQITDLGIDEVEKSFPSLCSSEKKEEIVKLSPEFYGVGVNLRALWKKISKFFK